MSGAGFLQEPRVVRIGKLLQEIYKQHVRVPRFQRPFVWTDEQRLALLDSIYRGMPVGSILVWRTSQTLPSYDHLGHLRFAEIEQELGPFEYVLDGHQRLTTLYAALMPGALSGLQVDDDGGDAPAPDETDEDTATWPIYFDLKEREFRLRYQGKTKPPHFLPLDLALDSFKLFEFQRGLLSSDEAKADPVEYKKMSNRAEYFSSTLRDYTIPVVPLATEKLSDAAEAFRRINSSGQKMSEAHMAHALMYSESIDLSEQLEAVRVELIPLGWGDIEHETILKVIKAGLDLDVVGSVPDQLVAKLKGEDVDAVFERAQRGLERAINFLQDDQIGVFGPKVLPYELQLVLLADALTDAPEILDDWVLRRFRRWFWQTTNQEEFSGSKTTVARYARKLFRSFFQEVEGFEHEWHINYDQPYEYRLTKKFDMRTAQTRAFCLILAHHARQFLKEGEEDPRETLAREGAKAMWKLPSARASDWRERFLVAPESQKEVSKLLSSNLGLDDAFLKRHMLRRLPYRGGFYDVFGTLGSGEVGREELLKRVQASFWERWGGVGSLDDLYEDIYNADDD